MSKLGKKQTLTNEAWLNAVANIEQNVSLTEIKVATEKVIGDIKRNIRGKKPSFAWSGGKDSIVLAHICAEAGITDGMLAVCDLEYPAFMAWLMENKPVGCDVVNTHQDLAWLSQHLDMLFPDSSTKAARWFAIVQHRAQRHYFANSDTDIMLLGRRRADGNYVGRKSNFYEDGSGVVRYSPLADWTHEHILAYIHYNNLALPPIYGWHNGYMCGTHPWAARQYTKGNGWQEVYDIDPSIVMAAAEVIPAADRFLGGVGR